MNAAYAVSRIADDATKARLKPLALTEGEDDPDDQLKGVALSTLWPSQMTAEELFVALTPPKRQNLWGAYQGFASPDLVKHIQPSDLPIALQWVETQSIGLGHISPFSDVIEAIMLHGWAHLETPDVLHAVARAALKRLEHYEGILGERGHEELINQDDKRHRLLEALLPLIDNLGNNWVWLVSVSPLLLEKDIPWLITCLNPASTEAEQQRWALLIEKLAGWSAPTQLDVLIGETQKYPPLVKALEKLKADYPEKEKLRREWQRERRVEPLKPSPQERIETLLEKCENKDSGAWWLLNREMTLEPTSTYYGNDFNSDLTTVPGWKSADDKTRARIIEVAKKFLLEQGPNTSEWLDQGNVVYHPALPGYRALELLLRESPDSVAALPPDVWKKWAPAIPTFPNKGSSDDKYHGRLIQLTYQHAPDELIQTVLKIIDLENRATGNIFITFQLRPCWDEGLSNSMLERLSDSTLKPDSIGCLLRDLLDHQVHKAREFAESLVRLSSSSDVVQRSKAVIAAQALLAHTNDAGWSIIWPAVQRDTEFGKAVFVAIASVPERYGMNVAQLSEDQLADLYLWLERNYPHVEDPKIEGAHSVSDRESIAHWRDSLLIHLKNRGTIEAVKAMERIVKELPGLHWLRWTLLETRDLARRGTWVPPRPADIIKLTRRQRRPRTRNWFISITLLVIAAILFVLTITGSLIASWIQQDVLRSVFTPGAMGIILLLTVVCLVMAAWLQGRDQAKSQSDDAEN